MWIIHLADRVTLSLLKRRFGVSSTAAEYILYCGESISHPRL